MWKRFLLLIVLSALSVNGQTRDISLAQQCFDVGEGIAINYQAANVQNFDEVWIGIYNDNASINTQDLGNGILWLYLCGTQACNPFQFPAAGSVTFGANSNWSGSWPLPQGRYQAVLTAAANNRWRSISAPETFDVGCGGGTTPPSNGGGPEGISVSSTCVPTGSTIDVSFSGVSNANVFVGIYRSSLISNLQNLPGNGLVDWLWTCGNNSGCGNWPSTGTVQFGLNNGEYRAVISDASQLPFSALAATQTFEVGCNSGTPPPQTVPPTTLPPQTSVSLQTIQDARTDIENLINGNPLLRGKFLRLVFHDCVGGCDGKYTLLKKGKFRFFFALILIASCCYLGCVDMNHPDNAGLVMPINALQALEDEYESLGLSRTDLWMLSGVVAADVSVPDASFPFQWVGRRTCEDLNNNNCGFDFNGQRANCGRFGGPNRALCHGDTDGTRDIQTFMAREFGFDEEQTVAIMGAHSIGAMRDVNVGFQGLSGWDLTNDELDRGYFVELVGTNGDPVAGAPDWEQVLHPNGDLPNIPDRWQYESNSNGTPLTMLNSDIALVRNLVRGQNLNADGRVTCDFKGPNACSSNTPFLQFVQTYARDEDLFIDDFRDTLDLLIENGYRRVGGCGANSVCTLQAL